MGNKITNDNEEDGSEWEFQHHLKFSGLHI